MSNEKEWQEANRELIAEDRRRLGDPPTAEEMLAFTRGELSESEEERIRDLLVVYPELARMYCEPFPDEPRPGEPDYVSEAQTAAGWNDLQQHLRKRSEPTSVRDEAQRGRVIMHRMPTAVAAALAIVFFGLYVQAEGRARYHARQSTLPRVLGVPQELQPEGNRGSGAATMLRKDGEAYLLKPRLNNQPRYPHYQLELHDANGVIWSNRNAQLSSEDDSFDIVIPHAFLREGETYRLRIVGVDGEESHAVGTYDLNVPAE